MPRTSGSFEIGQALPVLFTPYPRIQRANRVRFVKKTKKRRETGIYGRSDPSTRLRKATSNRLHGWIKMSSVGSQAVSSVLSRQIQDLAATLMDVPILVRKFGLVQFKIVRRHHFLQRLCRFG